MIFLQVRQTQEEWLTPTELESQPASAEEQQIPDQAGERRSSREQTATAGEMAV